MPRRRRRDDVPRDPGDALQPPGDRSLIVFVAHPSVPMWRWAWAEAPAAELARRGLTTRVVSAEQAARLEVEPGATVVATLDHPPAVLRHFMDQGPFVAVVNDDLWGDMSGMARELGMDPELLRQGQRSLWPLVAEASAVAVTAEPLVKIVTRVNRRVRLVPWSAPPESEWPVVTPREGRGVRLGWVGLPPRESDFLVVRHALTRLVRERPDLEIVFWGVQPSWAADLGLRLQFFPAENLGPSEFYARLAALNLDVVIAPVAATRLNQSRSQAKFIDAALAGCPLVATRFGPYRRLADAGAPIVTVPSDPDAWLTTLRDLLDDGARRRRAELTTAARAWVAKHATIDVVADDWLRVIEAAQK